MDHIHLLESYNTSKKRRWETHRLGSNINLAKTNQLRYEDFFCSRESDAEPESAD